MSTPTLFHSLLYDDADAAIAFLTAVGFTERGVHRDPDDASIVVHAEFAWGECGGIMFGSVRACSVHQHNAVGRAQAYLVVAADADVDAVHAKALAAGATEVREPADMDYGGRGSTFTDPEGNQWSLGSYQGT